MSDKNYHRIIGEQFPLPSVTYTNCDSCDRLRVLCGDLWIHTRPPVKNINKYLEIVLRLKKEGVVTE